MLTPRVHLLQIVNDLADQLADAIRNEAPLNEKDIELLARMAEVSIHGLRDSVGVGSHMQRLAELASAYIGGTNGL